MNPSLRRWSVLLLTLILVVGGSSIAAQGEEPPRPVASSVSVAAPTVPSTVPEDGGIVHGELDQFFYLPITFHPGLLSDFAQQVVDLTNQERARAGCSPLSVNLQLVEATQGHSEDMAFNDFFSHTGSDGSLPWDRMEAAGYAWREAGENIAVGYQTPQSVMNGWMNSTGHRANILKCSYEEIGVGYVYLANDMGEVNYRHYWTQVFGRPR